MSSNQSPNHNWFPKPRRKLNMPSDPDQPAAKRMKVVSAELFTDIPADKFMSKVELFQGPTVDIIIGSEDMKFTLPKALLCHRSAYFEAAFNGLFGEAVDQVLRLPDISINTFQLVVQYLYTGNFVVRTSGHGVCNAFLRFFQACDYFELHCSKEIKKSFKASLLDHGHVFSPSYANLKIAMELPSKHEARQLMVEACITPFAKSLIKSSDASKLQDYDNLVAESNEFAADLLKAYKKAARHSSRACTIFEPITGNNIQIV